MATFNKFNQFVADIANKVHNLGSDTLKVGLTNTAPVPPGTRWRAPNAPTPPSTSGV